MEVEHIKKNSSIDRRQSIKTQRQRVAAYCRVSRDTDEQLNSYRSQKAYYTDLIEKNPNWTMVGIYADEAITGTQTKNRTDFQRMINDCMEGQIDMIITKSISRFARNTLDTLKYVRLLKERDIPVLFEEENINTLTMDGELLLTILSSVAQQEVENISEHVKKGLKMKMKRGELVGLPQCLGYDYNKEDKSISINEEEARIVKYIFERYNEGIGSFVISHELNRLGYKTKRGKEWTQATVIGIIKNEKYKGDVLQGKTFTVDPISHRRLDNRGEEDQFYIRNHHEPIISEEEWQKAQDILRTRSVPRQIQTASPGERIRYSRQYTFSSMLECGFCGSNLSRRNWHSGSKYTKRVWACVQNTKKGKKYCPESKSIPEKVIEDAFVVSYNMLCGGSDNKDVIDEFMQRVEKTLEDKNKDKKIISDIDHKIDTIINKKKRLLNLYLDSMISNDVYKEKSTELEDEQKRLLSERQIYQEQLDGKDLLKDRLAGFRKVLEENNRLTEFDPIVFETCIEKVIVGEVNEEGIADPYKLIFIYKTGVSNKVRVDSKSGRKKGKGKTDGDEAQGMCSSHTDDRDRDMCSFNEIRRSIDCVSRRSLQSRGLRKDEEQIWRRKDLL